MSAPSPAIARSAAARASVGVRSISTLAFTASRRAAASRMIAATMSAATESPWRKPASAASRPTRTATEPSMSAPKWKAFERSAGLW